MTNPLKTHINSPELIRAIRIAYRVAWLLPLLEAASYTREIVQSWKSGDARDTLNALELLRWALGNLEGSWGAYTELRNAIRGVAR